MTGWKGENAVTERINPQPREWNIEIIEDAWRQVENARDDLEQAGMLSKETAELFMRLQLQLDVDLDGFKDANRY
jgi:hypothetical protein